MSTCHLSGNKFCFFPASSSSLFLLKMTVWWEKPMWWNLGLSSRSWVMPHGLKSSFLKCFTTPPSVFVSLSGSGFKSHFYPPGETPTFMQWMSQEGKKLEKPNWSALLLKPSCPHHRVFRRGHAGLVLGLMRGQHGIHVRTGVRSPPLLQ